MFALSLPTHTARKEWIAWATWLKRHRKSWGIRCLSFQDELRNGAKLQNCCLTACLLLLVKLLTFARNSHDVAPCSCEVAIGLRLRLIIITLGRCTLGTRLVSEIKRGQMNVDSVPQGRAQLSWSFGIAVVLLLLGILTISPEPPWPYPRVFEICQGSSHHSAHPFRITGSFSSPMIFKLVFVTVN